jgi:hypothetical protein
MCEGIMRRHGKYYVMGAVVVIMSNFPGCTREGPSQGTSAADYESSFTNIEKGRMAAKLVLGMNEGDVKRFLGEPDGVEMYGICYEAWTYIKYRLIIHLDDNRVVFNTELFTLGE